MCTRTKTIQSNQNIENNRLGRAPPNHLCDMILYRPFSCNLILTIPLTVK